MTDSVKAFILVSLWTENTHILEYNNFLREVEKTVASLYAFNNKIPLLQVS